MERRARPHRQDSAAARRRDPHGLGPRREHRKRRAALVCARRRSGESRVEDPEPQQGARLRHPRQRRHPAPPERSVRSGRAAGGAGQGEIRGSRGLSTGVSARAVTKRVLIVDDEPLLIDLLREIFARFQHGHAYEVTPAYTVVDAYDLLRREQFDLVLLDMVVPMIGDPWPWIQGLDLLKRVRQLGVKVPIFMMTGVWNTEKEAEALIEGAAGYLHKPFDQRELNRLVTLALAPPGG
ncbi:MAG: hypothetical protein DME01_27700 [Candidatus Rokuibacteriota bacterium]|nr:MAG: hypothetical protein DME01_27700 [Candidatus Rokubacteria bacterium]